MPSLTDLMLPHIKDSLDRSSKWTLFNLVKGLFITAIVVDAKVEDVGAV